MERENEARAASSEEDRPVIRADRELFAELARLNTDMPTLALSSGRNGLVGMSRESRWSSRNRHYGC